MRGIPGVANLGIACAGGRPLAMEPTIVVELRMGFLVLFLPLSAPPLYLAMGFLTRFS